MGGRAPTSRGNGTWMAAIGAGAAAALLASCGDPAPSSAEGAAAEGDPWFEEVCPGSGIDFVHATGHDGRFWFPEISAGGVGLLDYDGDGDLDVYLVQAGTLDPSVTDPPGNKLYRNRGDWTFEDVTAGAGVGDTGYGSGCACGDYDGDGDPDLYVTNLGPNVLYRNNGDGTFTDVTEAAGVGDASWGTSAAFIDYDQDGHVDLLMTNYVRWSKAAELDCFAQSGERDYCAPKNYNAPSRDTLYRNNGDGTFRDVTAAAGLDQAFGNGFGIACADYNLDGHLDFYITNDGMANQLWIATGDGRFTDQGLMLGCALNRYGWAEAGMGVAAVDVDNDGDADLFMSHIREETNTFYINEGGSFEDATARVGLATPSMGFTGFGLGFADFDNDGHLDLYVANGRVRIAKPQFRDDDPFAEPNQLFRGGGGMRYEEVMPRGGTARLLIETSRGAAFGDLDNDGDVDIVVVNKDARPYLLRNAVGLRGHWVMFRVRDRHGRDADGAWVGVDAAGRRRWHLVQRAYSFCASNDPRTHVGLGAAARAENVEVRWPDGRLEAFGSFPAGEVHELREGTGLPAGS
jgi:hypothetical protein